MGDAATLIVYFRMGERLVLTALVLVVAVVLMAGFWRTLSRVDFQVTRDKLAAGGSTVLATPVFLLVAMICYAWVALSHPISLTAAPVALPSMDVAPTTGATAGNISLGSFTGVTARTGGEVVGIDASRNTVIEMVRSLNCLVVGQEPSPTVESDFIALKLSLLEPAWSESWGEYAAFAAWAIEGTGRPPSLVRAIWEETHRPC